MKELEFIKKLDIVFGEVRYISIAVVSSLLIGFLYAVLAELVPVYSIIAHRSIPFTLIEMVFMVVFSLLAGITIAFYFYSFKNRIKGICTTSSGVFFGLLTGVCPYCPVVLPLLIGVSISIEFLYPIFPYLRIISLSLLIVSLYWVSKGIKTKKRMEK